MSNLKTQIKVAVTRLPLLKRTVKSGRDALVKREASVKWRRLAANTGIKLELGSGSKLGSKGWTTVDVRGADINWDLRHGIPLKDGSVEAIYTSHLLEHIPYEQLIAFLRECRRLLKPGGELLVCVPNARYYIDAYVAGEVFRPRDEWWSPASVNTNSCIDQLNYIAYMGGEHHYLFDTENLVNTLLSGGFAKAELRNFDIELDMPIRDFESIYARASV